MDIRFIHVKNVVPVSKYEFITTILIRDVQTPLLVREVRLDGIAVPFIRGADHLVLLALPGVAVEGFHDIVIDRAAGGTETLAANIQKQSDPKARITTLHSTMLLSGVGFYAADEVWVNGKPRDFAVVSHNVLMTVFPDTDATVDSVEVIVPDAQFQQRALFRYTVAGLQMVSGPFKAAQQFIACLLSSAGSDLFDSDNVAGGLSKWPGTTISAGNEQLAYSQIVVTAQKVAAFIAASQAVSRLPLSERLASVSVVGIDTSPENPAVVNILFRLTTQDGQQAQFNSMINQARAIATRNQ